MPYGAVVRWERLFADLEAQLAAARAADDRVTLRELVRAELATVALADRLRAAVGSSIALHVGNLPGERDAVVRGEVVDVGAGWVLIGSPPAQQALVPMAVVVAVGGLPVDVAPPAGPVESRIGLGHALRALARDRVQVRVYTPARQLTGRLDRVGADHVDVVGGLPATAWTVPLAAIRVVRAG